MRMVKAVLCHSLLTIQKWWGREMFWH
jgi:hypothetical protein